MTKSTTRLALLSSSSLGLAAIVSAAAMGAALAPTAAAAQTAACVSAPPPASGNGTDEVVYTGDTTTAGVIYNPSIDCAYTGTGAAVRTTGNIGVSTVAPGGGINLTATGADSITWDSTAGLVRGGAQTNGPIIEALSESGAINISTDQVTATQTNFGNSATATHGIRAVSNGGGAITVTSGDVFSSGANAVAAVEAISTGGNGAVTVDVERAQGRLYGIIAQASGSGALNIRATERASGNITGIDATAGTGLLTIDAFDLRSTDGPTLRVDTAGDSLITLGPIQGGTATTATIDISTVSGTQALLTLDGRVTAGSSDNTNHLAIAASGGGDMVINGSDIIRGRVDFSAHTGELTWNQNGQWGTSGDSIFGSGDHTLIIGSDAQWLVGIQGFNTPAAGNTGTVETTTIAFGGGEDRVVNNGLMLLGPKSTTFFTRYQLQDQMEMEVRLLGLETFENAGTIYFGASALPGQALPSDLTELPPTAGPEPHYVETDYTADDVFSMPGTHWIASEGSRLVMDAYLTDNQPACDVSLRNTEIEEVYGGNNQGETGPFPYLTGDMPAADCMGLQGGSTEGVTSIQVNTLGGGDRGGPIRIVLVDVAGGQSDTGHFVLDPLTIGYDPTLDAIDAGYFIFPLVYDAEAQQHVLLGTAGQNAWQTATWAAAAHDLWRTSTGTWFDRQADLRGDLPDGVGGGIWMRTSGDVAQREVEHLQPSGTSVFAYDNSYEQSAYAVTGGVDLMVGGGADTTFLVGLMAGYANSKLTYDASPNRTQLDSWNGGLYASFLAGGLYLDAALSANKADVESDMPGLNLFPAGTVLSTPFQSVGVQVEGGWRFPLSSGMFVEPLAGVSWVRTEWEELTVPSADPLRQGVDVDFGDPVSLRGAIGARLGLDQDYGGVRAQYSLLGRVWNEAEGEHELTLGNVVEDVFVRDALTGTMSELGLGASIYGSVVSGFLNVGGKWADDYESVGGAVGIRVAW